MGALKIILVNLVFLPAIAYTFSLGWLLYTLGLLNKTKKQRRTKPKKSTLAWHDYLAVACVFGVFGIALKFISFFEQIVYFPAFPNILDSAFLIFAVLFLSWRGSKLRK